MKSKRLFFAVMSLGLILVLALSFNLAGCSSTSTATATTTGAASTTTTTATVTSTTVVNPIVLRVPTTAAPPPSMGLTLTQTEFADLIKTRTQGRVQLEIYWSETLAKGTETVNALATGIADFAYLRSFAEPGKIPLCTASELPGVSNDNWSLLYAYWDLINQPEISAELAKYNLKPVCSMLINQQMIISSKPIRTIAELAGKKVAASGVSADIVKALGGTALAMSPAEQYEGISRGTVDAICAPVDAIYSFKFYEGAKYFFQIPVAPRMHPVVITRDAWNRLTPGDQKIITDLQPEFENIAYNSIMVETAGPAVKAMQDAGVEFITPSADDLAAAQKVESAYADKWASDMEAKGLPGNKVLSDYRTFAAKYEKTSPYIKK